jgi:RNA polymerase sigma factor (sigma-70 family)
MDALTSSMTKAQLESIEDTVKKERRRLFNFIRQRVPDKEDAEDILQDVFFQFLSAYKQIESLEKTTSWLFRVARNKIIDKYRKKKPDSFSNYTSATTGNSEDGPIMLEDILPDLSNGPDEVYARSVIWTEIENALEELPLEQKQVFVLNEFEDKSFKEISEMTGVTINTLLSRKRYAVLFLRKRLQDLYDELSE